MRTQVTALGWPHTSRLPYAAFFFFFGILAPDLRASLSAIATACLRLFTFFPLPDFSLPCLCSFITLWILRLPLELDELDFRGMTVSPRTHLRLLRVAVTTQAA